MKLSLPFKLAIFIILLFAAVIATCLLWTPLRIKYYASKCRSEDIKQVKLGIRELLSIGARSRDKLVRLVSYELEHSPLERRLQIAELLVVDGPEGMDVLSNAFGGGDKEAEFLARYWTTFNRPVEKEKYGSYPLHIALKEKWNDAAALLVARGADVNAITRYDKTTPLHWAALNGNNDMVALLIGKGADVEINAYTGETALHNAVCNGHKDTVELLIRKGANVNAKGSGGLTPLHEAAAGGHNGIVALLIEKGADVNLASELWRLTPLHSAARYGSKDAAVMLIEKGADVNPKDVHGETPLHRAAMGGQRDTAAMLIEKGADVNSKEDVGWTPLHRAAKSGSKETVVMLIEKGAELNPKANTGETPFDWADTDEIKSILRAHGGKSGKELRKEAEK
jgi:ankyrin repeat protein